MGTLSQDGMTRRFKKLRNKRNKWVVGGPSSMAVTPTVQRRGSTSKLPRRNILPKLKTTMELLPTRKVGAPTIDVGASVILTDHASRDHLSTHNHGVQSQIHCSSHNEMKLLNCYNISERQHQHVSLSLSSFGHHQHGAFTRSMIEQFVSITRCTLHDKSVSKDKDVIFRSRLGHKGFIISVS